MSVNIAVLVSGHGRGSNLQAIVDACKHGRIDGRVALIVATFSDAPAVDIAHKNNIPCRVISPRQNPGSKYATLLLGQLKYHSIDLVCLAGFMLKLPARVINIYRWKVMNIHPALIPSFCGKGMHGEHVHQAALDHGVKVSGCTVHFVDEEYDTGPIIIQKTVPVEEGDTASTLAARVLVQEHAAYPEAIQLFAQGRLRVEGRVVRVGIGKS